MAVTGEPDGPPGKCGVSVIVFAGGYAAMVGLMVGLFDAQRTGVGRDVDVSLLDTAVSMLSYFAVWTLNRDWIAERTRNSAHQTIVPAQNFATRDGWIVVFCNKDKFGATWWRPWAPPSWSRTRASAASPTGSRTRTRSCRSCRPVSPPAPPTNGWTA